MNKPTPTDITEKSRLKDEQLAAILSCASIAAFLIWYWTGQIQSVIELLRLAYG